MIRTIRKTSSLLHITYMNGNYSDLYGENFEVDATDEVLRFIIDLGANLRVRNKASNRVHDINEFAESHNKLKAVQVNEEQILRALNEARESHPKAAWKIRLHIGNLGTFDYQVNREPAGLGCAFNVVFE